MSDALVQLVAANIAFVGTHFAMSHPLRAPMVKTVGNIGFQVIYTLVSIATLVWVYLAYKAAPVADLAGTGEIGWIITSFLALIAMVLFAGSIVGNPAMPAPNAGELARSEPRGMFRVTRHPMMWGFGIWAVSHVILWASWRSVITAIAMGFLALVGAYLQDRKKEALMGDAWAEWESKTSYWPRWGSMLSAGLKYWLIGAALWLALSWAHIPLGGMPAGIWRWL